MRFAHHWSGATVLAIRDVAPSVREFLLRPDGGDASPYAIGSHINVAVIAGGRPDTRSYSLVGSPQPEAYKIAVHRAAQSRGGSAYMWSLKAGARLEIIRSRLAGRTRLEPAAFLSDRRRHRHHADRRHGTRAGAQGRPRRSALCGEIARRGRVSRRVAGHAGRPAARLCQRRAAAPRSRRDVRVTAGRRDGVRLRADAAARRRAAAMGRRWPRTDRPALRDIRIERAVADPAVHGAHPRNRRGDRRAAGPLDARCAERARATRWCPIAAAANAASAASTSPASRATSIIATSSSAITRSTRAARSAPACPAPPAR